jgi:tRNA G37 N-methylase TrmD
MVPEVLLSGDHEKIAQWRTGESARVTRGAANENKNENNDSRTIDAKGR